MEEHEIIEELTKYTRDCLDIWQIPYASQCEKLREAILGILDLYFQLKEKNRKIEERNDRQTKLILKLQQLKEE